MSDQKKRWLCRYLLGAMVLAACAPALHSLEVGFGVVDITPDINADRPVWIAGYGQNRRATAVHDPIFARSIVLRDGSRKVALVVADVVGIFYPTTLDIRQQLPEFDYVMVAATHNHEGPDTMGLWGPSPLKSGVDTEYMESLKRACVQAVQLADKNAELATADYGVAENSQLLRDSRQPQVFDGVLRALRFSRTDGSDLGLLIQWNCHPETMGPDNKSITADFLAATVSRLERDYRCPVIAVTGAVGGLMAPPRGVLKNSEGDALQEGDFEYCLGYGEAVAELADQAIQSSGPVSLTPIRFSAKAIALPMTNPIYQLGATLGLIQRQSYLWTGDHRRLGEEVAIPKAKGKPAIASEVSHLLLGQLHVVGIPGELYPELVYGQYQQPVEPHVDFPEAELEKPVAELLTGDKFILVGLANDELGYIIPKRQWDDAAPFAYGRSSKQYGEVNSIGPDTAPIILKSLEECVMATASQQNIQHE